MKQAAGCLRRHTMRKTTPLEAQHAEPSHRSSHQPPRRPGQPTARMLAVAPTHRRSGICSAQLLLGSASLGEHVQADVAPHIRSTPGRVWPNSACGRLNKPSSGPIRPNFGRVWPHVAETDWSSLARIWSMSAQCWPKSSRSSSKYSRPLSGCSDQSWAGFDQVRAEFEAQFKRL